MKITLKLTLCLFPILVTAQSETMRSFDYFVTDEEGAWQAVELDEVPIYEGGEKAMLIQIYRSIRYPAAAREGSIQGTVYIGVTLDAFGQVTDLELVRDIGAGCGQEALRAMETLRSGRFSPAILNGKAVPVRIEVPVRFRLE